MDKIKSSLPEGYDWTPLPPYLRYGVSAIHGIGVFAKDTLEKHHVMTNTPTHIILPSKVEGEDNEVIRTQMGGLINHSSIPNGRLVLIPFRGYDRYYFRAISDIKKGEELTLDYHKEVCGLGLRYCKDD